jgi:Leucine-rich repeat (LRR) protein
MKLLLLLLALPMIGFGQNVNIPDANFKAALVGNASINTNMDSEIQITEANSYSGSIDVAGVGIANLTGIEAFTALTYLGCYNNQLTSLDVSACTALTYFDCFGNQLTSLDVSSCTALTTLGCGDNQLTSLDVSGCTALTGLGCYYNQLTSLDVSSCTALTGLGCYNNQLTSLDVSSCTALTGLICESNQLTSLDVSACTALTTLYCDGNQLTSLDVSANTALTYLICESNQLTSLDVRNGNNTNFLYFNSLYNPNLTCINVDDATWSNANWTSDFFDFDSQHYFSNNCSGTGSIQELNTNKKLLKVTDLLGRETKATNQVLIHIYDDGTLEKKIVFE